VMATISTKRDWSFTLQVSRREAKVVLVRSKIMVATQADKDRIKRELVERLKAEPEVRKVIISGRSPTAPSRMTWMLPCSRTQTRPTCRWR
jgi:hypothetical protein